MADNYLEKQYENYLQRKENWLKSKGKKKSTKRSNVLKRPERPEDESL